MDNSMIRFGTFPIETILPEIEFEGAREKPFSKHKKKRIALLGYNVGCHSLRLALFKEREPVCVHCGLRAEYFALENHKSAASKSTPHLNLYGKNAQGEEVLFTKDHIIPLSKGGKDNLSNLQILCYPCNHIKGNVISVISESET